MSSSYTLAFRGLVDDLDRAARLESEVASTQAAQERNAEVERAFERLRQRLEWAEADLAGAGPVVDGQRTQDGADQAAVLDLLDVAEQTRHAQHLFDPASTASLDAAAVPGRPARHEVADVVLALALVAVSLEAHRLLANVPTAALAVLSDWPGIANVLPTTTATEGN